MSIKTYAAIRYLIPGIFFLFGCQTVSLAQSLKYSTSLLQSRDWSFVENKGQIEPSDVYYYGHQKGVFIYCKKDRIAFSFTRLFKDSTNSPKTGIPNSKTNIYNYLPNGKVLPTYRFKVSTMEMELLNSNSNVQIIATDQQQYNESFYQPDFPEGIKAQSFKKLTYKNIYPHIDMVLSCKSNSVEYSFVVNPGGNLNDIQIQWNGTDSMRGIGENTGILYANSLGFIKEGGLKGYLNTGKNLNCRYLMNQKRIHFVVGDYDRSKVLTIDPLLSWGTYYGGTGDETGTNIATDRNNNVYVLGRVGSQGLATAGSYMDSLGQNGSLILVKFDNNGNRLWATYYPSKLYDAPYGLAIDKENNIYIAGSAIDSLGIATKNAWQSKLSGTQNSFIAKFDPSGTRIWGTYFGTDDEGAYGLAIDKNDNPIMIGYATHNSNIATSGAYSTKVTSAFGLNAFAAKFTPSGKRLWCTYCDEIFPNNIALDSKGSIYISGWSGVKNLATTGAFQTTVKDSEDGFIFKLDSGGTKRIWSTYFGASAVFTGLTIDNSDNIYLCGFTPDYTDTALYATKGVWQTNSFGQYAPFIEKFRTDGSRIWGTFFGADGSELNCITNDQIDNIYVGGIVTNNSNSLRPCYESPQFREKALLAKFSVAGQRIWAIQFGGSNYSQIAGLALDQFANIFTVGVTNSSSGVTTNGAFQASFGGATSSSSGDIFIDKFSNSTQNANYYGDTSVCNFSEHIYVADSTPCAMFNWTVIGGKILKGQHADSVYVEWNDSVTSSSLTCIITGMVNDTITKKITIYKAPSGHPLQSFTTCSLYPLQIGFKGNKNDKFFWSSDSAISKDSISNPIIYPAHNSSYYLTETNLGGCKTIDTVIVKVNPIPQAKTGGDRIICFGNSVILGDSAVPGNSYEWTSFPAGVSSAKSELTVMPHVSTTYYLTETINATGCKKTDSVFILVNPLPFAITAKDTTVCAFTRFQLGVPPITGHTYHWTNNISLSFQASTSSLVVFPSTTVTYYLTERVTATSCSKTDSVTLKVIPFIKPDAGASQVICKGELVQIGNNTSSPGYTYSWHAIPSGVFPDKNQIIVNPSITTRYYLNETDLATGCSGVDSTMVTVNPLPNPKILGSTIACKNDSINLYKTINDPGSTYLWTIKKGQLLSAQGKDSVLLKLNMGVDTITLKETDINGCQNIDSLVVQDYSSPDAHWKLLSDSPVYIFRAIDSMEQYYHWFFGDGGTGYSYLVNHKYDFTKDSNIDVMLIVASAFGCSTTFDSTIKIKYIPPPDFYVDVFPNPFEETTTIKISLSQSSHIQIKAYDEIGRLIAKLVDVEQPAGITNYGFDASKNNMSYGVYYIEILVDGKVYVKPIIRIE